LWKANFTNAPRINWDYGLQYVKQSSSWEADSSSAIQEIPLILMNAKFHHYICKTLTIFPVLSQKNPDCVLSFNLFKIHFSITLPLTSKYSTRSVSFRFPHVSIVRISLLPHAYKRPSPRCLAFTKALNFSCEELSTIFQLQDGGPTLDDGRWLLI
jgi:hypothetical protein